VVLSPWEPWLSLACPWVLVSARLPISSSIHLALYNWKKKQNQKKKKEIFPPLFGTFPFPPITAWFESSKSRILFSFCSFFFLELLLLLIMIFSRYYRNRSSSLPCALFKKKFRVESNDEGKHSTVSRRDFLIDLKVEIYKQTNKT
jgi:phosphoglycerol transferase MdoB-like AlkP superfamily enzyme